MQNIVRKYGLLSDFIGQIGGDDFVIITEGSNTITLAENIINEFDKGVVQFYNKQDMKNGFIVSTDRNDKLQKFPIMTISVAIIVTNVAYLTHFAEISKRAAELKKLAKKNDKSSYVFERRKYCR